MLEYIISIDQAIFLFINQNLWNSYTGFAMFVLTQLGNGYFLLPLVISGLLIFDRKNALKVIGISIIAILFGGIIVHILKELVQRPRPLAEPLFEAININVCGRGLCGKNSFPSGHSQAAFSIAAVLSGYYKKRWLLFYLLAGLTAFSRVYIGVHYPFDIVAGGTIGYIFAKLALLISQRFNFKRRRIRLCGMDL